jgi:hypothetical protein
MHRCLVNEPTIDIVRTNNLIRFYRGNKSVSLSLRSKYSQRPLIRGHFVENPIRICARSASLALERGEDDIDGVATTAMLSTKSDISLYLLHLASIILGMKKISTFALTTKYQN